MARHSLVYSSTTVRRRTGLRHWYEGHKVVCPDVVPSLWPQPHAGAVSKPESTTLGLFGWYFESSPSPDSLHPLVVHSPSLPLQHGSHPPVPIPVNTDWPAEPPAIVRASSSSAIVAVYLCVDRGCSSARQARRSEMPYRSRANSTHLRRRAGLRSFPVLPPLESGCPTSGPIPHA